MLLIFQLPYLAEEVNGKNRKVAVDYLFDVQYLK